MASPGGKLVAFPQLLDKTGALKNLDTPIRNATGANVA